MIPVGRFSPLPCLSRYAKRSAMDENKKTAKQAGLCNDCCAWKTDRCGAMNHYGADICPRIHEQNKQKNEAACS